MSGTGKRNLRLERVPAEEMGVQRGVALSGLARDKLTAFDLCTLIENYRDGRPMGNEIEWILRMTLFRR